MPTPPLPSRDDDEHGAMPADCRVETLRAWLATNECVDHADMARTVRALVEAKVREAVMETAGVAVYLGMGDDGHPEYDMDRVDGVVSRVIGAE